MTRIEGERNRAELEKVVREVRTRWRVRHLLRGLLLTGAAAAAALLVVAAALDGWGRSPFGAVLLTVVLYAGVAFVALRTLVRPLLRRVSDRQVALYLEEHEPELEAEVFTAVESLRDDDGRAGALLDELVRSAVSRARTVEGGRRVDREPLRRLSWTAAAAGLVVVLLMLADPLGLRTSLPTLARPWTVVEAASPRMIQVAPGDTVVPRGAELRFAAHLAGFESDAVELAFRSREGTAWERWPMLEGEEGEEGFGFVLFRVEEELEYFAEAEGVRSGIHRVEVVDLPYVSQLELEIRPPAYTGLPPQVVEDGGDLAVLPGTVVRVRAHSAVPVAGGRVVLDGVGEVELEPEEGGAALGGEFRVDRSGFYRVELDDRDGRAHRGTPDHVIDLLEDLPPLVTWVEPRRDLRATSVEEVYVEARATDDHGIAALDLVYSVNGEEEQTVSLLSGSGRDLSEVSAGHTFFLEELDLEPGDLVAYHARARDHGPGAASREARTDLFFIQVRPFSQEFRQSDAGGGGMQGGGEGDEQMSGQLSTRQREIVTATFNVERDRAERGASDLEEDVTTITLAQERLRDEVETLARRLVERGITTTDPEMRQVAEELPRAAEAMGDALEELQAGRTGEALAPEQRALQHLLRAEAAFREVQLQWNPQQQGGTRSGDPGEDLADFFDLELDRMRNQYEELQRGEREQADRELAESLDRLRELARRQQQEAERLRRAAERLPPGAATSGGDSQRRLAEETEEAARRLERLAREQSSPELEASAQRLREAAEAMRRSAASRDERGLRESEEAAAALEEARRLLDRSRDARLDRDAQDAAARAERALQRQERIQSDVENLPADPMERRSRTGPVTEQKEALRREVDGLEAELRRLARESAGEDGEAARAFQDAAERIRDGRIGDRIDYSRSLVERGRPGQAEEFEEDLTQRLQAVRDRVGDAADALAGRERDRSSELAERTRDLLRGAESMEERLRRAAEAGQDAPDSPEQGGGTAGPPDEETIRQLQREAGERARQAEELGRALSEAGVDYGGANDIARSFRSLTARGAYADPLGLQELQRALVEELRELDFIVRRQLAGPGRDGPAAEGSGEVPESYRSLVEEYFRSLARPPS